MQHIVNFFQKRFLQKIIDSPARTKHQEDGFDIKHTTGRPVAVWVRGTKSWLCHVMGHTWAPSPGSNMVAIPRVCGKYLWVWNFISSL